MKQSLGLTRAFLLATGVLILFLSGADSNPAQAKQKPKKLAIPQNQSNMELAQAIHMLQSIKKTLEGADHDYGGHRAAAVRDIGQAEKQLREALHEAALRFAVPVAGYFPLPISCPASNSSTLTMPE